MQPIVAALLPILWIHGGHSAATAPPQPSPWPPVFHAVTVQNRSGSLALVDLYYEYPRGRNANLIYSQLSGSTLFDIEYTNHTSYYFNRVKGTCRQIDFPVGILSPDWISQGASYLGLETVDAQETHVWSKGDSPSEQPFITYYESISTGLPVRWIFFDGAQFEILKFTVNETLPEEKWQAPAYCFERADRADDEA